jgi:hypothetical protein
MRLALCSLVLLAACTSHEVRCDAHLLPINLPAPTQVPGAGAPAARTPAAGAPVTEMLATGSPPTTAPAAAAPASASPPPEAR